jgi:hypothetical protein
MEQQTGSIATVETKTTTTTTTTIKKTETKKKLIETPYETKLDDGIKLILCEKYSVRDFFKYDNVMKFFHSVSRSWLKDLSHIILCLNRQDLMMKTLFLSLSQPEVYWSECIQVWRMYCPQWFSSSYFLLEWLGLQCDYAPQSTQLQWIWKLFQKQMKKEILKESKESKETKKTSWYLKSWPQFEEFIDLEEIQFLKTDEEAEKWLQTHQPKKQEDQLSFLYACQHLHIGRMWTILNNHRNEPDFFKNHYVYDGVLLLQDYTFLFNHCLARFANYGVCL